VTYPVGVRVAVFRLLAEGHSISEVSRQVGVSRAAIWGWRVDVGGVDIEEPAVAGRYLSRDERYEIARLHGQGLRPAEIAGRLGRSRSTISRELNRPIRPVGSVGRPMGRAAEHGYQPEACHQAAVRARARPRPSKLVRCPRLAEEVQTRLDARNSPEQIAGRLAIDFPDDEQMRISHETIYQAIYVHPKGELRRQLRTGRTTRKHRNTRQPRTGPGHIVGAVSIHDRPADIEERLIPGHYEGDLVVGPLGTTAAIGTLVERTSGHLTGFHLPLDRTSRATIAGLTTAVNRTGWPMSTLTWDRGQEMAGHAKFSTDTGITVYFADPYAPWQRGSNENTNGLLREYFPKGLDLATITDHDLQTAIDQINNRPRKRHHYRTPNEVLAEILTKDQSNTSVATTD
jgi:transposase, IS30 family